MFAKLINLLFGTPCEATRSPDWPALRRIHLERHPTCAACGSRRDVVPHHLKPVHAFPDLELRLDNLLTLCEGPVFNCHLFFGHLGDWSAYNPRAAEDAALMLKRRKERVYS